MKGENYMPTASINSSRLDPVYARMITSDEEIASEGKLFYVSTGLEPICPNEQLLLQLGNPSESGLYMNIRKILICSDVESFVGIYKNFEFKNSSNDLIPRNSNTTGYNNSVIKAKCIMPAKHLEIYDCDLLLSYIQLKGTETIDFGGALKFYSGSTFTICVSSKSNTMSHMSITTSYSELPY